VQRCGRSTRTPHHAGRRRRHNPMEHQQWLSQDDRERQRAKKAH
jgi:hypothetical protein